MAGEVGVSEAAAADSVGVAASEAAAAATSVVEEPAVAGELRPLSARQQRQVERTVHEAEARTGLQLCVYLGPAGEDSRAHAEQLFVEGGLHSRPAVLMLVAPQLRRVEIVTAPEARARIPDEAAQGAVDAMTARFAEGDLPGGPR